MTLTVNSLSRCAGQNHYTFNVTVSGGPTVDVAATLTDMQVDFTTLPDAKASFLDRMRSAIKEANASNSFVLAQAAVEGKVFKL